jgi:hypothetical protein
MSKENLLSVETMRFILSNGMKHEFLDMDKLYISLHYSSDIKSQSDKEINYTGYRRQPLLLAKSFWKATGKKTWNEEDIIFPEAKNFKKIVTSFAIGTELSGKGKVLLVGEVTNSNFFMDSVDPIPQFESGDLVFEER